MPAILAQPIGMDSGMGRASAKPICIVLQCEVNHRDAQARTQQPDHTRTTILHGSPCAAPLDQRKTRKKRQPDCSATSLVQPHRGSTTEGCPLRHSNWESLAQAQPREARRTPRKQEDVEARHDHPLAERNRCGTSTTRNDSRTNAGFAPSLSKCWCRG